MKHPALRLRLLLGTSASILVALVLAGIAISTLFADHVQRSLVADLNAQFVRLVALVDVDAPGLRLTQPMPDPRFEQQLSGLYWQIRDPASGITVSSRSLWDGAIAPPAALPDGGSPRSFVLAGPDGGNLIAVARKLIFDRGTAGPRTLEILVAETTQTLDGANAGFRADLIRDLAILAIVLVLAAWIQVTLGLAPLAMIRRSINAIRTGEIKTLDGPFPAEVMPLVAEVNALLEAQETSIAFSRERASDLAHGLKTNLMVLNFEAQTLREAGNETSALAIEQLTQDLAGMIDHQLALARLRHRSRIDGQRTPLLPQVLRVVDVLKRTRLGDKLTWTVEVGADVVLDIDPSDLTELLGILLENAMKWAATTVRVTTIGGQPISVLVEDDGPGLTADEIGKLGRRGQRLDERRSGTGIGISIANEIVSLNSGWLKFQRAEIGGLSAEVQIPAVA